MSSALTEVQAHTSWACVDFISDLHLQATEEKTLAAWQQYLASTPAQALFILGDLFEVWVGDDAAQHPGFEADCAQALSAAARRLPIYFMHGNRDFLLGAEFAHLAGLTLLSDPCVLFFAAQRWLLSHGDALCLADTHYQAFRALVRGAAWQQEFLRKPLAERQAQARGLRELSEQQKRQVQDYADLDTQACVNSLRQHQAQYMIHGHTHKPAQHRLPGGLSRIVLSDWDASAKPPRGGALRLSADGRWQRLALA